MSEAMPYGHRDTRDPENVTRLDEYRVAREASRARHPGNPNSPIREQLERDRFGDAVLGIARRHGMEVFYEPDGSDDIE